MRKRRSQLLDNAKNEKYTRINSSIATISVHKHILPVLIFQLNAISYSVRLYALTLIEGFPFEWTADNGELAEHITNYFVFSDVCQRWVRFEGVF